MTVSAPEIRKVWQRLLTHEWRRVWAPGKGQRHVAVESCTSEAENANCVIVRVDQPPKNGALVTFNETRAALIKRIASCTMKPLRVMDGKLGFPP